MKQLLDGVGKFYLVSYGIERYLRGELEALRLLNLLKTTYSMLFETNKLQEDGSFYLSFKKINNLTGLTRRKFEKARKVLLEKNLISVEVKNKDDEKEKYKIQFFKINVDKYNQIVLQDNGLKLEDIEEDSLGEQNREETQIIEVPELPKQTKSEDIALATKLWNEIAKKHELPKVRVVSEKNIKDIKQNIKEVGVSSIKEYFSEIDSAINNSDFLRGKNDRGWKINFNFITQKSSMNKLFNNAYENTNNFLNNITKNESKALRRDAFIDELFKEEQKLIGH